MSIRAWPCFCARLASCLHTIQTPCAPPTEKSCATTATELDTNMWKPEEITGVSRQQLDTVLQRVRSVSGRRPPAADTDPELLDRSATARDEAAFAALVARHYPMVLGVCRRVLNHAQDAEDACQATFLALARQAATVRRREGLAGWRYRGRCRM